MNINKTVNGKELTVALEGRLDTATSPALEAELKNSLEGVEKLVFDFASLEYLSSAGLRVLLGAQIIFLAFEPSREMPQSALTCSSGIHFS